MTLTGAEKSEMRTSCMTMTANVVHSSTFNHAELVIVDNDAGPAYSNGNLKEIG